MLDWKIHSGKNRTPTRSIGEKWYGRKPDDKSQSVRCTVFARVPDVMRKKVDDRGVKLKFVGYTTSKQAFFDDETKENIHQFGYII